MTYVCPDEKCPNDETLEKTMSCSTCGKKAVKFNQADLDELYVAKAEYQVFKKTRSKRSENSGLKVSGKVATLMELFLLIATIVFLYQSGSAVSVAQDAISRAGYYGVSSSLQAVFNTALIQLVGYISLFLFLWITLYYVSRNETP